MYYKLYRRRKYIYFGILTLGIVVLILKSNSSNTYTNNVNDKVDEKNKDKDGEPHHPQKSQRINMKTYVEPEPCLGCPGENGAAVFLSVIIYKVKPLNSF